MHLFPRINANETHKAHQLPQTLTKPKLATKLILSQVSEKGQAFRLHSSLGESEALTIVAVYMNGKLQGLDPKNRWECPSDV
ncbi:hypothetical protein L6452_32929 [Arctium lappa]|uniref:Uncharacterized protein n=1 Tax=Arctium lappa TaxID=4217 RepID=A0ACB8Z759_ARCLA|nr:hypothetical protein L6452_32929 [Arctium lappa]